MPLSDTVIRQAKPESKTVKLFDGRGLYLELTPKGGKWWRFKYRFLGKEKRLSLGVYPDVSLKVVCDTVEETSNGLLEAEAARLRSVAGTKWGTRRYINMDHFKNLAGESAT